MARQLSELTSFELGIMQIEVAREIMRRQLDPTSTAQVTPEAWRALFQKDQKESEHQQWLMQRMQRFGCTTSYAILRPLIIDRPLTTQYFTVPNFAHAFQQVTTSSTIAVRLSEAISVSKLLQFLTRLCRRIQIAPSIDGVIPRRQTRLAVTSKYDEQLNDYSASPEDKARYYVVMSTRDYAQILVNVGYAEDNGIHCAFGTTSQRFATKLELDAELDEYMKDR